MNYKYFTQICVLLITTVNAESNRLDSHSHPLDPLSKDEITQTTKILESSKENPNSSYIYNYIGVMEPPKSILLPFFLTNTNPPEKAVPRKSFTILMEGKSKIVYEAVVNLDTGTVESFTRIDGVRAMLQPPAPKNSSANNEVLEKIGKDSRVIERCASLGYTNMSNVLIHSGSYGFLEDVPKYRGKQLGTIQPSGINFPDDNFYAHPFDFIILFDKKTGEIVSIEDLPSHSDYSSNNTGNTAPKAEANYDYKLRGGESFLRKGVKPIKVDSPEGVSFKSEGYKIEWQKWSMRWGFNAREGLVLYQVGYNDSGTHRPIMYRGSLSEMYVPYGDPRPPYYRKVVFDEGQIGLGLTTVEQTAGEDVITTGAKYFDNYLYDNKGGAFLFPHSVSVREEDAGFIWRKKGVAARSHRLVLTFLTAIGNYDYLFSWIFYQDGGIEFNVDLTGIVSVNLITLGQTPGGFGEIVAPQINAQYHHHFFTSRLDLDIDGSDNSVEMVDVVSLKEDERNPFGQGFTTDSKLLRTADQGRTNISARAGRKWKVSNPSRTHPFTGNPVSWRLVPSSHPPLQMTMDSPLRQKAHFLDYDVWVTQYKDDQLFAGGTYLNMSGLPLWVKEDPEANIVNTDVVLWHNFGVTHFPRVEDFPVMPVEKAGFWIKPFNFFKENPAIDVPQFYTK